MLFHIQPVFLKESAEWTISDSLQDSHLPPTGVSMKPAEKYPQLMYGLKIWYVLFWFHLDSIIVLINI